MWLSLEPEPVIGDDSANRLESYQPEDKFVAKPLRSQQLYDWLDRRIDLTFFQQLVGKKQVPMHRQAIWYYMGGIALILLLIQVLTGLLLMVYYVPEIKSAHASILLINSQVDFGWFIRSMHSWGANLMVLALFFHLFSTYFMKAYRPPRELTWLSGIVLMGLVFGFGFTGYLLPWDETSFFATKIGIDITSKTPLVGPILADLLRGGADISQATLSRFFTIHVMLLPLLLLPVIGLHLWLVQVHGMTEPTGEKIEYEKFFPTFLLKDAMVWVLILNLLAILVTLAPWGVGQEADPFTPAPVGIKPEWYFLAMFQFLKLLPPTVGLMEGEQAGMLIIGLVTLGLVIAPFLDYGRSRRMMLFVQWYGRIVLLLFVVFTIWGVLS